jgi:hypothetical protein
MGKSMFVLFLIVILFTPPILLAYMYVFKRFSTNQAQTSDRASALKYLWRIVHLKGQEAFWSRIKHRQVRSLNNTERS